MTFATDDSTKQAVQQFQGFDVDTQLGLLWFGYLDIKDQLNPANSASAQDAAGALYDQIKAMSKEEQLQAQRDIASGADNDVSRTYSSLSSSGKLDLWLRLSQGMEEGVIIHPARWINMMQSELDAGAVKVIAEARESGTVGIFHVKTLICLFRI